MNPRFYGYASWYCSEGSNELTANGEGFDETKFTAAHRTLPFGTYVRVTRLDCDKNTIVRINDRGPYKRRRIIDLTTAAAEELDMVEIGITKVCVEVLD
jgi:rare lipoprotein A